MFIETDVTPNPATLKFLPGRVVLEQGSADFDTAEAATISPLASVLFELPAVERVFLGSDFVSVTKSDDIEWPALKPQVLGAIMEHYLSGRPVMMSDAAAAAEDVDPADRGIADQIKELLDARVRPAVAGDGGDIVFRGYRAGVVTLHMQGACSGCPSSTATLKMGIENLLRHYVPEVTSVQQVAA
jgi:Fe-S cluster biogenesis protein NfuA